MKNKLLLRQLCVYVFLISFSASAAKISDVKWDSMKKQALDRKRQIIYNTDGCDALYFPKKLKVTKENFIKQRLIHAIGSKIDTISYCPLSSGFGYLTSKTKVGDQLLVSIPNKKARNITGDLLKMGTDPLKITEEFCRKNNFEFFVTLRCNDTHDTSHRKNKPHPLFPPYKSKHPEYLMGSYNKRPPHCSWSAVDFTHKEVRNRWVAIAEELMTNYDLDGLELDFCRHLQYFKSVAWGNKASEKECQMITDCMRKIRAAAERIGRKRGKPILISARLPDCIDYSKAVGLDVEKWMQEKLIDIYIGGFYFQLKPWKESVEVCKKYGIKFYPSLDESRIRKVDWGFYRTSQATYRARVAAALQAGADGIYFFNIEGARNLHKLMRGNMDDIRLDDKQYFISYLYYEPKRYLKNGDKYNKRRKISQYSPVMVYPDKPLKFVLEIGDDFNHPDVKKSMPVMTAYADTADYNGKNLVLKVNGHKLRKIKTYGFRSEWLTQFAAPLQFFKPGVNELEVLALPNSEAKEQEMEIMSGTKLLKGRTQAPWRRLFIVHDFKNSEKIVDGAYCINDSGTKRNEFASLLYPMGGIPGKNLKVRFQAKVKNSSTPLATVFRMADGRNVEIVTFQPGKLGLHFIGKSVKFNTADNFHDYEAIMKNGYFILKVDGKELFNEKLKMTAVDPAGKIKGHVYNIGNMHRQSLLFGSLSGKGTGAALWKNVCLVGDGSGVFLKDLKFELKFAKTKHLNKYADVSPNWEFKFDVVNGKIPTLKNLKNTYKKENLIIVDGDNGIKAIEFDNSKAYQAISVNDSALTQKGSDVLLAEWKIKYLSSQAGKGCFTIALMPLNTRKQTLMCSITLFSDTIRAPWGNIKLPKSTENCWNTFRLALDVKHNVATLWMNGKKIGAGAVPAKKKVAPSIFFGDGSGGVAGKAELEYIKITTVK